MKPKPNQEQNIPSVVQDGEPPLLPGFPWEKPVCGQAGIAVPGEADSLRECELLAGVRQQGSAHQWQRAGGYRPERGLSQAGTALPGNRVKLILLTHGHPDHAGSAALLRQSLHIPVAMGKADLPLLGHPAARPLYGRGLMGKALLAMSRKSLSQPGTDFTPELLLEGGEDFYRYGFSIRVLALPGHTAGSMGYEINHRYLCTGDAVMNLPWPAPALLFEEEEQAAASTAKIAGLGKRILCPGHGSQLWNRQW